MSERRKTHSDEQLKQSLMRLGSVIRYPEGDGLPAAVRARIESAATATRSRQWSRPVMVAALASLLVAVSALTLAISPGAREAVADVFGLGGVRIRSGAETPTPQTSSFELGSGQRVSLQEASARASFPVAVPRELLGEPREIYLSEEIPGGQVALVYGPSSKLPSTSDPRIGLLITQFRGDLQQESMGKQIGSGTRVEIVEVNGAQGLWLEGAPHSFFYLDSTGEPRRETIRLAGNTLLWERGGITYRLESALERSTALEIARSIR